jgi:hypothetical protein
MTSLLKLEILLDLGGCICGTPDEAHETARRWEAAGVDLLPRLSTPTTRAASPAGGRSS